MANNSGFSTLDCGCVIYHDGRGRAWCPSCVGGVIRNRGIPLPEAFPVLTMLKAQLGISRTEDTVTLSKEVCDKLHQELIHLFTGQ